MKRLLLALLLPLLTTAQPAWAHKIRLFATAEGMVVSGYAYFSGGDRAQEADFTAAADGRIVHAGKTAADGSFRFTAATAADHLLTVDGGDGHMATFTVKAAEFSAAPVASPPPAAPPSAMTSPKNAPAPVLAPAQLDEARLAQLVESAAARQIRPLREQLDAFQDAVRLRDALGGLGYIIGLAGLAWGLAQRRKEPRS